MQAIHWFSSFGTGVKVDGLLFQSLIFPAKKSKSQDLKKKEGSRPPSLSFLYMRDSLKVTFLSSGYDNFPVIITFYVFSGSFCKLQSHLW